VAPRAASNVGAMRIWLVALVSTMSCGRLVSETAPAPDAGSGCTDTTSSKSCGRCGHDCLSGTCVSGTCQSAKLAGGQVDPNALIVDDSTIYWVEDAEGTIRSMPKAGGETTLLLAHDYPRALAVDATTLYYAWSNGTSAEIFAMPKHGGESTSLAKVHADAITVDETSVYFTSTYAGEVGIVPKSGGQATILAKGQSSPTAILAVHGRVCWVDTGTEGSANGSVVCDGSTLASGLSLPAGLATDGEALYFGTGGGESVDRVGLTDGASTVVASGIPSRPLAPFVEVVAVDTESVYWITTGDPVSGSPAGLLGAPKNGGGEVETIDSVGGDSVRSVAADGRAVYWSGPGNAVWRRAN